MASIDKYTGELTIKSTGTATGLQQLKKRVMTIIYPISATYLLRVAQLSITLGIKNIKFEWSDFIITGKEHYRLLSDIGGGFVDASTTGFVVVPNSTNIRQTHARADIALHRYIPLLKNKAEYLVEACDNTNACSDNPKVSVSLSNAKAKLNQLIGYIKASNTDGRAQFVFNLDDNGDQFGTSVSLSDDGNTLAVGAINEDGNTKGVNGEQNNNSTDTGAVYVFFRDSSSAEWQQQAYIKASNSGEGDKFGTSVSLSSDGNTLAVGAPFEDHSTSNSGVAYVFTRSGKNWQQKAYIKASNADADDYFGNAVSLSGDGNTLAVAAEEEDSNATGVDGDQNNNSTPNSGAVYVFTRKSNTWTQQAYIKASNTGTWDTFGKSVSLSGDGNNLAVGASGEDSNSTGSGAVYVFTRSSTGTWSQQAYIKASNAGENDFFGSSVSLSGDSNSLAIGAPGEDSAATGVNRLKLEDDDNVKFSGAAYVFTHSAGVWSQQAYIKASNTDVFDEFGRSVSLSKDGNSLAVGARGEDSNAAGVDGAQKDGADESGAVYVFTRSITGTWNQQAYVKASNTGESDQFGYSVSLSGDGNTLAVGARREDGNTTGVSRDTKPDSNGEQFNAGAVYLY